MAAETRTRSSSRKNASPSSSSSSGGAGPRLLKGLPERVAAFYAGCVVLALEHLHERGVVYRDLKPENVFIDAGGYGRLGDFGFAKALPRVSAAESDDDEDDDEEVEEEGEEEEEEEEESAGENGGDGEKKKPRRRRRAKKPDSPSSSTFSPKNLNPSKATTLGRTYTFPRHARLRRPREHPRPRLRRLGGLVGPRGAALRAADG